MNELRVYVTPSGKVPFNRWFDALGSAAAAKVIAVLERLADGNFSNVKGVGSGVSEYKLHFGPGYRVYFGSDGEKLVILLIGGSKKGQSPDIELARAYWAEYKKRKKAGETDGINQRFS